MKLTKTKLKEMIREELLKEEMTIRKVFYELGKQIGNLEWLSKRDTDFDKDRKILAIHRKFDKLYDELFKHLQKEHPGWDSIRN